MAAHDKEFVKIKRFFFIAFDIRFLWKISQSPASQSTQIATI